MDLIDYARSFWYYFLVLVKKIMSANVFFFRASTRSSYLQYLLLTYHTLNREAQILHYSAWYPNSFFWAKQGYNNVDCDCYYTELVLGCFLLVCRTDNNLDDVRFAKDRIKVFVDRPEPPLASLFLLFKRCSKKPAKHTALYQKPTKPTKTKSQQHQQHQHSLTHKTTNRTKPNQKHSHADRQQRTLI